MDLMCICVNILNFVVNLFDFVELFWNLIDGFDVFLCFKRNNIFVFCKRIDATFKRASLFLRELRNAWVLYPFILNVD
ncbi:hypothetical protein HanPSC8_Chr10g0416171 [Helianthus annuus]|nr:hypothetical protein HanPSC8_Chr10g0416171 [Helianthus annuus]